jgi:hypothetical protein
MAAHYFPNPEMLGTRNVCGQNSQRIGGVFVASLNGTPIQGFRRQTGEQVPDLPAQVLDSLQVVLYFRERCFRHSSSVFRLSPASSQ